MWLSIFVPLSNWVCLFSVRNVICDFNHRTKSICTMLIWLILRLQITLLSGGDIWFIFRLHQRNIAHVDGCDKHNNLRSLLKYLVWLFARILRSKESDMWKSWNLINRKKFLYTNFLKLEYVLLWPMFNLGLKVAQIWYLSSEIQGFGILSLALRKGLKPLNLR